MFSVDTPVPLAGTEMMNDTKESVLEEGRSRPPASGTGVGVGDTSGHTSCRIMDSSTPTAAAMALAVTLLPSVSQVASTLATMVAL
jgi:hypothetical protein